MWLTDMFNGMNHILAVVPAACKGSFLGLKSWFYYFPDSWFGSPGATMSQTQCQINGSFDLLGKHGQSGLVYIAVAMLDDLLRIAALVAVAFVIYGGFSYVTSQGSPDNAKKALKTIISALVGLAITIVAGAVVGFLGMKLSQ